MINIAQILSECPKNTKLYSPIFGDVYLYSISPNYSVISVTLNENGKSLEQFLCDEKYTQNGECMLFPSQEQRDWSKFQRPFKDGDVVTTNSGSWIGITMGGEKHCFIPTYCVIKDDGKFEVYFDQKRHWSFSRLATEEEKVRLFQAIKDNGYKWNSETKVLEKLIEPHFKVGDIIKHKDSGLYCTLEEYSEGISAYRTNIGLSLTHKDLEQWELVPNKFDINTLVPFDSRVLVRDCNSDRWKVSFWGCLKDSEYGYKYDTVRGCYKQCIPYEGNEHLLGKTGSCDNFYKTW